MRSGYYNQKILLKEGTYHIFRLSKLVELEDGKVYMILEDEEYFKYFLEYEPYKNYNLKVKSDITCIIDKINCTGRIFLEPLHPVYKVGEMYSFIVVSHLDGEDGGMLTVTDCYNNHVYVSGIRNSVIKYDEGSTIIAKVERIRKGLPDLTI